MKRTKIEWVKNPDGTQGDTWNFAIGCRKASPGCQHCYAERQAPRLGLDFTQLTVKPERLPQPLHVRKPTTFFPLSMSDFFLPELGDQVRDQAMAVMAISRQHRFILVTKRPQVALPYLTDPKLPERVAIEMAALLCGGVRPPTVTQHLTPKLPLGNLWLLVSCEDQRWYDRRVPVLMQIPAVVRGVSLEPLLGPIQLAHGGLDWVIVGGESGPHARPMHPDWVRSLRHQCQIAGLPFLFKQWGEWLFPGQRGADGDLIPADQPVKVGKKAAGRLLDGELWDGMPAR